MNSYTKERLEKYLYGNPSEADIADFRRWLSHASSAAGQQQSEEEAPLHKFWEESLATAKLTKSQKQTAFDRITAKIYGQKKRSATSRLVHYFSRVAAAIVIPLLFVSIYVLVNNASRPMPDWVEVYTRYGETRKVALPDGSQIWLNSGTYLFYPESFSGERRVFVSGEAFLDVKKNPDLPFVVDTRNISIKVHGTKFNIRSYTEDVYSSATLLEGSISLKLKNLPDGADVMLEPGDRALVNNTTNDLNFEKINVDDYASWRNGEYVFRHKTLGEIARELERIFDVQIVINDTELLDDTYFVTFAKGMRLDQMIEALNVNDKFRIRRNGRIIYIDRQ